MAISFARLVTIVYVSLNVFITLIVSILGVKYVREDAKIRRDKMATERADNLETQQPNTNDVEAEQKETDNNIEELNKMGFVKLWFKLVWKMRSCYMSLVVHVFDVLTDILVIIQWWSLEQNSGDITHINSRQMAWWGIIVL
eukprot:380191_1